MAVVQDYYIGATHIIICDDSLIHKDEIPALLKHMGEKASRALYLEANAKANEDETA
jgi:hypothetical protein